MFPRAITLGRVRGIPVRVDPTLLVIGLLVAWSFTGQFGADDRSMAAAIVMAVSATILFFASILAHELGHALEARHRDMEVHGITLFLFGGVTEMRAHASRARDDFVIAAVGPWSSVVVAAIFGLIATGLGEVEGAAAAAGAEVAGLLGWLNLVLAIFNLVPGAPLDGGRVLRALLWGILGDRRRASRWAARAGQGVGVLVMGLGILAVVTDVGDFVGAIWLVLIGSFIFNGASAELRSEDIRGALEHRTAADLVRVPVPRVDAGRMLSFVELDLEAAHADIALVTDNDVPTGFIRGEGVLAVEPFDREIRTAGDVQEPLDGVPTVHLETPLEEILDLVQDHPAVLVVGPDGDVRSLVTARLLAGALQRPSTATPPPPPPPPRLS
ncbi:MAG: site-2 protease family protein [Nitriliruptorales bacterium]|nr:site-2 protease family protein [Nitriliruptorales bacterium]